jgi:hypothetical protein
MLKSVYVALAIATLGVSACDLVTDPTPLEEFAWEAVPTTDLNEIAEGIDATGLGGEITFLGQFRSDNLCFTLDSDFSRSGNNLQLDVKAKPGGSPDCGGQTGGFRYTGVLRHLRSGTYTLKVSNIVPNMATKTFSIEVEID